MKAYALKNNLIEGSSSGAAFPTLVDAISEMYDCADRLVIYGVAFSDNFEVIHERKEFFENWSCFKGSKYVKSNLNGIFQSVENDLENNKFVIFTGTPCQIYGLKMYLDDKNIYTANLILVDLICHGTPKPTIWNDYIKWIELKYNSKLEYYSFRYQKAKWKTYPVMAKFSNGKKYINTFVLRQYIDLFLNNLTLQEGCFTCKFASLDRCSDFTLGDFWGIRKVMPEFGYKDSVSLVIANTDMAEYIMNYIDKNYCEKISISPCLDDNYIRFQDTFKGPRKKNELYDEFWKYYKDNGFEKSIKKYGSYNWKGFLSFCIRKVMNETKLGLLVKSIVRD